MTTLEQLLTLVLLVLSVVFIVLYGVEVNKSQTTTAGQDRVGEGLVTVQLQGGLGNQMFQIATAYAYAQRHQKKFVMNTTETLLPAVYPAPPRPTHYEFVFPFVDHMNNLERVSWHHLKERRFEFDLLPKVKGNVRLDGYFQSEMYFYEFRRDIRELFTPNSEKLASPSYIKPGCVSMHIRRGDYLQTSLHNVQQLDYYRRAITEVKKLTGQTSLNFVVFSDDLDWCREELPRLFSNSGHQVSYCDVGRNFEQLYLMSRCTHHILANSSFSWWSAYLGSQTGVTIAPQVWFSGDEIDDWSTVYLDHWVVL
jgi:hypothetical protein